MTKIPITYMTKKLVSGINKFFFLPSKHTQSPWTIQNSDTASMLSSIYIFYQANT